MLVDAQGAQHLQAEAAGGGLAIELREIGGAEEGRERAEARAIQPGNREAQRRAPK
jgi:hypothetical protein